MSKKAGLPNTLTTVTLFSKVLAVVLIFAFILTGVYVGMVYQRMVDATAFSSYIAGIVASNNGTSIKTITQQDNGKTTYVHVGDIVTFQLGSVTQRWTLSFSSSVLKRISLGIAEQTGQEGRYLVVKEGKVVITGVGVANCPRGSMCPMYAMQFTTTLVANK